MTHRARVDLVRPATESSNAFGVEIGLQVAFDDGDLILSLVQTSNS
jgi:hypothetical protein